MSLSNFNLTKSWESAEDFPTFEEDEAKVREDMQCLFTELEVGLQKLIDELSGKASASGSGAAGVGLYPVAGLSGANNLQDAVAALKNMIDGITIGTLGEQSVSTAMLKDLLVTTIKLADLCVTRSKIADGAVDKTKCDFASGLPVAGNLEVGGAASLGGKIFLDADSYGDTLPATAEAGRLFFLKVQEE